MNNKHWIIENMDGGYSFWLTYQNSAILPAKDNYRDTIKWLEVNQPVLTDEQFAAVIALNRAIDRELYIKENIINAQ
jgi:hypothetical protein